MNTAMQVGCRIRSMTQSRGHRKRASDLKLRKDGHPRQYEGLNLKGLSNFKPNLSVQARISGLAAKRSASVFCPYHSTNASPSTPIGLTKPEKALTQ